MLQSLREAFRQAVANFRAELHRDDVPDTADELLRAMKRELVELELRAGEVERELTRVRAETIQELSAFETCVRREKLAMAAGDPETAQVARDFAERHRRRHEILSKKVDVVVQELHERRSLLVEMTKRFKEARLQRETLPATAGRAESRERLQQTELLFDEMERMADRIDDLEARAGAAEEVEQALADPPSPRPSESDLDARLADLKRDLSGA